MNHDQSPRAVVTGFNTLEQGIEEKQKSLQHASIIMKLLTIPL